MSVKYSGGNYYYFTVKNSFFFVCLSLSVATATCHSEYSIIPLLFPFTPNCVLYCTCVCQCLCITRCLCLSLVRSLSVYVCVCVCLLINYTKLHQHCSSGWELFCLLANCYDNDTEYVCMLYAMKYLMGKDTLAE